MRSLHSAALAVAAMLVVSGTAAAHEFWLEPDDFAPGVGKPVGVHLFVGDLGGAGERNEIPRRDEHLVRFEAVGPAGSRPIVGRVGDVPAGYFRPRDAGPLVLVYRSGHTFLQLPAEKFESYLDSVGLSGVIAERVRRKETLEPGRESYARYAKALVLAGPKSAAARETFESEVGLPIEFVAESDPGTWREGDPFVVRLLYDGRPLADQPLKLIHLAEDHLSSTYRTDAAGRVELFPAQAGRWLVASVYMRRAPEGVKGDWESFWASLTMELSG